MADLMRLRATQITAVAAVLLALVQVGRMITNENVPAMGMANSRISQRGDFDHLSEVRRKGLTDALDAPAGPPFQLGSAANAGGGVASMPAKAKLHEAIAKSDQISGSAQPAKLAHILIVLLHCLSYINLGSCFQ